MRSPFPGMDPYLEDPAFWPDFHIEFTVALRDSLRRGLPPNYEARLNEQITLIDVSQEQRKRILPHVAILSADREPASTGWAAASPAPLTMPLAIEEAEYRETWIEIRHRPDHSLVTVVEILSPTNKSGSERSQYLAKRRAILRQKVHLVELDLLTAGPRISPPDNLPMCDYLVLVARANGYANCEVYPCSVRQPLPMIAIPLKPGHADLVIELQVPFASAFEHGGYAASLDYSRPPKADLSPTLRQWAAQVARSASQLEDDRQGRGA